MIRRSLTVLAAGLVVALAPVQAESQDRSAQAGGPAAEGRTVISAGHVDLGPRLVDGTFRVQIRDDAADPPAWRTPEDVALVVPRASALQIPDDPRFAFLGEAGAESFVLPQVQDERLVWPGWNTQDPGIVASVRRQVTWSLDSVDGPGRFSLFSTDGFGEPQVLFSSSRPMPQRFPVELGTHGHGNWAFSTPGIYRLAITMSAATTDRGEVRGRATLQFAVGDIDPRAAFAAGPAGADITPGGGDGGAPWRVIAMVAAAFALLVLLSAVARRRRHTAPTGAS